MITLNCAGRKVKLDRPRVMGILNVTPDSFSDGGLWLDEDTAVRHALAMQEAGADIIDVGGESTRPGAQAVTLEQELERVVPVIQALASELFIPISIDTSKAGVMNAAVAVGAGMINDVCALRQEGALQAAAELGVPVCVMHMQGVPRSMQVNPFYKDVGAEVRQFLLERAEACEESGVARENIVLDPGFGFGKTYEQNVELFRDLPGLVATGYPLLVGVSRKAMIGQITGRETAGRTAGSVGAAALAAWMGAAILRVHDVAETVDALKVVSALTSN